MSPLVLLGALLLLWPSMGRATDAASSSRFFDEQARAAFARGDRVAALDGFFLVERVSPSESSAYNIATVADAAGRRALAFAWYQTFLQRSPADVLRGREVSARLKKLAPALSLVTVTSAPPGAMVYVDRVEHGAFGQTPLTVAVKPGAHRLILRAEGHEETHRAVDVGARGQALNVDFKLAPVYGVVTLELVDAATGQPVVPPGTRVEVDVRGARERLLPGLPNRLPVGEWLMSFTAPGYAPTSAEPLSVTTGVTHQVSRKWEVRRLPEPTGRLLVRTGAHRGRLVLDGRERGVTPIAITLPLGRHKVLVLVRGQRPLEASVEVTAGRPLILDLEPQAAQAGGPP
ncbi:MAG: PEGA domain-containing protein [Myxococcales bacterium]|nr:PEGA domain-containing protein [Myxococcales bacterium]